MYSFIHYIYLYINKIYFIYIATEEYDKTRNIYIFYIRTTIFNLKCPKDVCNVQMDGF